MDFILDLVVFALERVWLTLLQNWPFLALSILVAALLKVFVEVEKVSQFMHRRRSAGVVAATAAAVATPLCSCGTTAVVLGMMASTIPWAPIIAFMVASPLTSPQELVYSAGLFGWPFALAFFLVSILLGLVGGWLGGAFESRGWLKNQGRLVAPAAEACACPPARPAAAHTAQEQRLAVPLLVGSQVGCCASALPVFELPVLQPAHTGGPTNSQPAISTPKVTPAVLARELYASGKRLLIMFAGFTFVGYFMNGLIPPGWVTALFGNGHAYSVPLAATLGLPFYINTEASLPLVRALIEAGMSQGAALAFLVSGAGTSAGAIAGALTIARWRVVGLVIGTLWGGAIVSGLAYDLLLSLAWF
jgi:uncharacterized protein